MYSIFIGLTLGGIPVIWSKLSGFKPGLLLPIAAGLLVMIATVFIKPSGDTSTSSMGILALAGVLGASAMVLPGISGGYILLVMGQYVTILGGIDLFKTGLKSQDMQLIVEGMKICVPVGIGVVSGIVIVSHLIRFFFKRYEDGTYGLLLGLLVGAVFGLWPFQNPVPPQLGDTIRGLLLDTPEKVAAVDPKYFAVAFFTPSFGQIVTSILLIVGGFLLTVGIDRLGQYLEKNGSKS